MVHLFPNSVSYNRFAELSQQVVHLSLFLKMKGLGEATGNTFADSTLIIVCKKQDNKKKQVFKDIATLGI